MKTSNISARIDQKTLKQLEKLAKATKRTKSFLASEAIQLYVEEQSWQIDAIKEGVKQADKKNFAANDEVKSAFSKWGVDAD